MTTVSLRAGVGGVSEHGNWEHSNVLHAAITARQVAAKLSLPVGEVVSRLAGARQKLLDHRGTRIRPATDDKVLAAWNGMAIAAFAIAHQVLDEPRYLEAARGAGDFVLTQMMRDGRLLRTWRGGDARLQAYLEDYAFLADGLLCLFESDFDPRWLAAAKGLLDDVRGHFRDAADGAFFSTADDHEKLVARNKSLSESSIPSGQAMAVSAFLRAGLLLGDRDLEDVGLAALRAAHPILAGQPISCPSLLLAVEMQLGDPREVVIAGSPDDAAARALLRRVRRSFPPHHVVTLLHDGNRERLTELAPIYAGKALVAGEPAAYVCRRGVCEAPVTDAARLVLRDGPR